MTNYYVGANFYEDKENKEIHYDILDDFKAAQRLVADMAFSVMPYYLVNLDVLGMASYVREAIHLTQHVTEEKFNEKVNEVMLLRNKGCIVPVDIFLARYLPTTLDENGVHPESGYKYILQDDHRNKTTGEENKDGEAASNAGN